MRIFLRLLCLCLLCVAVIGCGNQSTPSDTPVDENPEEDVLEGPPPAKPPP